MKLEKIEFRNAGSYMYDQYKDYGIIPEKNLTDQDKKRIDRCIKIITDTIYRIAQAKRSNNELERVVELLSLAQSIKNQDYYTKQKIVIDFIISLSKSKKE